MPNIDDVPADVTHAGQGRNYTGPILSTVTLVNAPVDSSFRVVGLNKAAYDTYIAAEVAANRGITREIQQMTPYRPFAVDVPYDQALGYNYAKLTIGGRDWYLFIDSVDYRSQNSTGFNTTVDPFPSYTWGVGHCLIERGHAGVAASQSDTYGTNYCGAAEPFTAPPVQGVLSASVLSSSLDGWTIIVISANDLRGNGSSTPYFARHVAENSIKNAALWAWQAGKAPTVEAGTWLPTAPSDRDYTVNDFDSPYPWHDSATAEYYVPHVQPSRVSTIDGVTQGGGAYLFTPAGYLAWLSTMQSASWVVEGISEIRVVPTWCVSGGGSGVASLTAPPKLPSDPRWALAAAIPVFQPTITSGTYDVTVLANWRATYQTSVGATAFKKLTTGQFTSIIVGNGESSETFEPDLMPTSGVTVHARTGMAHGENTIRLTVDYNELGSQMGVDLAAGGRPGVVSSGYGRAAGNTASADLGLTNSAATNLLSRNAMAFNQALARHLNEEKIPMNMGIIGAQSVMQAGGSAAMGAMVGGPPGAIIGAVLGGGTALVTAGLSANNSLDLLDISQDGSVDVAAYQMAQNGLFTAQSFRTWVQALDSVSGKGHGSMVASAWRAVTGQAFHVIIAAPHPEQVKQILSTWQRYGYTINRAFKPPRLDAMSKFTYWKTADAVITGALPQQDRVKIAEAFDRGLTVFKTLADVGSNVSSTNAVTAGFTY